jgi:hypothetical protein
MRPGHEDDIRELVFREMLRKETAGETCYISFNESEIEGWIDPPEEFIARLQFPQLRLKKVSEARHPYYVRVEWVSTDETKIGSLNIGFLPVLRSCWEPRFAGSRSGHVH